MIFFHEKGSRFNISNYRQYCFSHWTSTNSKFVLKSVFAIQHIENTKCFTEVPPPSSVTKLILLHAVVVLHFTHHIKWHDWSRGGGGGGGDVVKCSKTIYYKSLLETTFVQTCR